jgi:hypothetical protein
MTPAQKMYEIFAGRIDSYGQDVAKDGDPAAGGMRVDETLTVRHLESHLNGEIGIGVYPTHHNADGVLMASWGCCDIDTGDWQEAWGLATALRSMNMTPHIERSRSKGWHIWIFPNALVTAGQMRRALKVAYAAIELPAKEANPKSEQLKPGQVGNYVRLPYKSGLRPGVLQTRQTFMSGWDRETDGFPISCTDWLYEFDTSCQTEAKVICDWSTRWKEPARKVIVDLDKLDDEILAKTINSLPGDLMLFVRNGPVNDRSAGMVALAHKLRAVGYTAKEIYSIISVADQLWGSKYAGRTDGDKWLIDIVERVVQ